MALRSLTNSEILFNKLSVSIGLFAELNTVIDERLLNNALESTFLYDNFAWIRLKYSNTNPCYWICCNRLPFIEKIEGNMNIFEYINHLCNTELYKYHRIRIFIQENKIGIIVGHEVVDGIIFIKTFQYIISYLNNEINSNELIANPNNEDISIITSHFNCNIICPIEIPSSVIKTVNIPCISSNGNCKQYIISICNEKYERLEEFINQIKEKDPLNHYGTTSTILTILSEAINIFNNTNSKSYLINCLVNLDKYINKEKHFIHLGSIVTIPIPVQSLKSRIDSVIKNNKELNNRIEPQQLFHYYNKNEELLVSEIDKINPIYKLDDTIKDIDVEFEYSSFGNYKLSSNINKGPFITQSSHGIFNIVSITSIQNREMKYMNFSITVTNSLKIERFVEIFNDLLNSI